MNRTVRAREELRLHSSFTAQLRKSWPIILIGIVGLGCGICLLTWNEGRTVQITKSLEEALHAVTVVSPDEYIDKKNYGHLVYMTGVVSVLEPLTEVEYGISVLAVKLKRRVQMFQWVEEEVSSYDDNGNVVDKDYYYFPEWKDKLIDSALFDISMGHWNPKEFPIKGQTQINENVKLGRYDLSEQLKKKFLEFIEITSDERPERKDIKLHDGLYYHSQDLWNPEVGDIRVQFSYAGQHGQVVTVVAMLDDHNTLREFQTNSGLSVLLLRQGFFSLEDIFHLEHSHNRFITWLFRGGGWLLIYLSLVCVSNMLNIMMIRFRVLREILPSDQSSLKMSLSMSISLLVTAMSWMWFRPLLGSSLVLVTISVILVTKFLSSSPTQTYQRL